ncbi:MAG: hypothetical protein Pg6C_05120 [Treponemataceae bacterium]|nr:MAG: hypothetical protein Pg6C_05120 [Treponemataceae bacterium]
MTAEAKASAFRVWVVSNLYNRYLMPAKYLIRRKKKTRRAGAFTERNFRRLPANDWTNTIISDRTLRWAC